MSNPKSQKLELTWIGKGEEPQLEPRILIENPEYSYGDPASENMLIHGDNLLALKALEQDYAGKVKCIYIDPPYNTGNAFENYDDGVEHSLWLNLMYSRLTFLKSLLASDGAIFIQLDENEVDYCKVICDEIFGRDNLVNRITIDVRAPSAFSTVNPGVFKASEYLLFYAKNRAAFKEIGARVPRDPDYAYNMYLINPEKPYKEWKFKNVFEVFSEKNNEKRRVHPKKELERFNEFIVENADRIARLASISDSGASKETVDLKYVSKDNPNEIFKLEREGKLDDVLIINGQQIIFYNKNVVEIDGTKQASRLLTNIWTDIAWEGISNEGGVTFKKGKKPEKLLKRVIELTTKPGDIVFDSFLGSGTTAAVAHKMGRKWIGVELGEHAITHCVPRLRQVVDGEQGGISKSVDWKGGGGFKFYTLAPSLLNQDRFGQWVINKEYNPDMLAAAMAKHEGFRYAPHEQTYWKQGQSTERDFIFTTTTLLTVESLDRIYEEMHPEESLLICCKAFQAECENRYPNITLRKIPSLLLGKCEFGKEDYSFKIVNLPEELRPEREESEEAHFQVEEPASPKKSDKAPGQQSLF